MSGDAEPCSPRLPKGRRRAGALSAFACISLSLFVFVLPAARAAEGDEHEKEDFPWDGSRTTPVHKFPMYDEDGQQIVPSHNGALPMSSRNTCGTCHTYSTVSAGWHFNSSKPGVPAGREGEPWVWVDVRSGTQLPLSYRNWKGAWNPKDIGISEWEFTKQFARHMPGGDTAEPTDVTADPDARWNVSGKAEVNCLACHNASPVQDHSEWALQIARQNFRWAATAAAGLGDVGGMASRMRETWTVHSGPNRDDNVFAIAPNVDFDEAKFDSRNRTVFDIAHVAPDKNCQQCHSASPAGAQRHQVDRDVHSVAGMRCADCHRNGLDHMIVRGYEDEAKERKDPHIGDFSCRGCHIGSAGGKQVASSGRMGAPIPGHKGIPPVHFEKMECTVCHSGPLPQSKPATVRTSRANRLGIHGRAQWFTDAPYIVEPVFVRGENGRVAPRRMMWPAFWARVEGEKVKPILPAEITAAGSGILDGEERAAAVLSALAQDFDAEGTPVLALKGKVFAVDPSGGLQMLDRKSTAPADEIFWGRLTTETLYQLVADFDPIKENLDSDIEARIIRTIEVLTQDTTKTVALFYRGRKITKTYEGSLESTETAEQAQSPKWVVLNDDGHEPLVPDAALLALAETGGTEKSLTESEVKLVLEKLALQNAGVKFAYISMGRLFQLDGNGKLAASEHESAKPVSWPIGHDVRPAAQSLGAKSCTECHSKEAAYLFSSVMPTGPLVTAAAAAQPMHAFQDVNANFQRLFGNSFQVRSAFKTFLFVCAGLLTLILLLFAMLGINRLVRYLSARA